MKANVYTVLFLGLMLMFSCGKQFLDIKRNAKQVVPSTIKDYQALLDQSTVMNIGPSVTLGIIGADEFYLKDGRWSTLSDQYQRAGYIWANEVYGGAEVNDWNNAYHRILYANLAMEIDKVAPAANEQEAWNTAKGTALFHRAYNYYQLAQLFCKPYDPRTAASDPGVPLRLDYDVTEKLDRSTVGAVYQQIIRDLEEAVNLLPEHALHTFRPGKAAACLILARTFLQMEDYEQAYRYADLGLKINSDLIDFNTLDLSKNFTFNQDYGVSNPEVLFYWHCINLPIVGPARFNADTVLLSTYKTGDIRVNAFFYSNDAGGTGFKGSYSGAQYAFAGLTTAELWLMRAECNARLGKLQLAMEDLNELLKNRYESSTFHPLSAATADEALSKILLERRKELFERGIRWEDLRRLNKDSRFSTTLVRIIDGQQLELKSDDARWVWPIPDSEVAINDLEQNLR